jgi:hypothetical protein
MEEKVTKNNFRSLLEKQSTTTDLAEANVEGEPMTMASVGESDINEL